METAYIFALAANLSFAVGVQFFTHYARSISSLWVNWYKGLVAALLFAATIMLSGGFNVIPPGMMAMFLLSGFIGLGIGDVYIIKAFSLMGPGRTMMVFGFQPLLIGVVSYFAFGQAIDMNKVYAIIFFIVCLFIFSLESFRKHGHWNMKATMFALGGVTLDGLGVLITRYAFDNSPGIGTTEGNFYRAVGALVFFAGLSAVKPFRFIEKLRGLSRSGILWITLGSVAGTYLSLMFYLYAVRHSGALAAVSGIAITGTLFASVFECILERKPPSRYLVAALAFFLAGMAFLL